MAADIKTVKRLKTLFYFSLRIIPQTSKTASFIANNNYIYTVLRQVMNFYLSIMFCELNDVGMSLSFSLIAATIRVQIRS